VGALPTLGKISSNFVRTVHDSLAYPDGESWVRSRATRHGWRLPSAGAAGPSYCSASEHAAGVRRGGRARRQRV
jgi:hypothetical protein